MQKASAKYFALGESPQDLQKGTSEKEKEIGENMFGKKSIYEEKKGETGLYADRGVVDKAKDAVERAIEHPIMVKGREAAVRGGQRLGGFVKQEAQTGMKHWAERRQAKHEAELSYMRISAFHRAKTEAAARGRVQIMNAQLGVWKAKKDWAAKKKAKPSRVMHFDPYWGWR